MKQWKKTLGGLGLRLITVLTAAALLMMPAAGLAAAEETVQSIEFPGIGNTMTMYVGDSQQISAVANVSGGSNPVRDITFEASWTSSNNSIVGVDKGLLSARAEGYADITVRYASVSKTMRVTVTHEYDKVEITLAGSPAASPLDVLIGDDPTLRLLAYKNDSSSDVTSNAEWTSSNEAVARVNKGKVTLIGPGSATIEAKYKGRSASVKLNASSPYEALELSPADLIEFRYGDAGVQVSATAREEDGGSEDVTKLAEWSTLDASVATVKGGLVKPAGVGKTTIRAEYKGVSKSITVVVRPAHAAMRLSVDKPLHLIAGSQPVQLRAFVADDPDMPETDITALAEWESSEVYAVTVSQGLVYPKAEGSSRIKASHLGRTVYVDVTVYPIVRSIEIEAEEISGFEDGEGALPDVTGETLGGEKIDISDLVEWTSSREDIVVVEDGKWFARGIGEAVLTARAGSRTAQVNITVHEEPLALLSDTEELTIVAGRSVSLPDVTLLLKNGSEVKDIESKLEWNTSSPNILVVNNEIKGLLAGRYTLTASHLGKKLTFRVTVEQEIVRLEASVESIELNPGKTKTIRVTGYYNNGRTVNLSSKVKWTSSNPSVASVSGSRVKAAATGNAALSTEYQGQKLVVQVAVVPKLTKLTASVKSMQLTAGESGQIRLTAVFDKTTESDVTAAASWTTSNERVAAVSNGKITAKAKGTAIIRAAYGGKTVSIRITVK